MKTQERRRAVRSQLSHPAKVLHLPSLKFVPAHTCDVSDAGALVRVLAPRRFTPGDQIEVYVQWGKSPLLADSDKIKGTVKRVLDADRGQVLGVEFVSASVSRIAA